MRNLIYYFLPPIIRKTTFIYFFRKIIIKFKNTQIDKRKINKNWDNINLNRTAFINLAIAKLIKKNLNDIKYLEIGCNNNENFNCISLPTNQKFGVDPVSGGNIRQTSDFFFSKNQNFYDVIFIDGLHTYEQCQKDVINSLKFLNLNGFIFIHDLIPTSWEIEHVPRLNGIWAGDVWKVSVELLESKGLDFKIIDADKGIGLIVKKSNEYNYIKLNKDIKWKKFSDYYDFYYDKMPILNHDEACKYIVS